MQKMVKVYVAALTLCLALAQGCGSAEGGPTPSANGGPAPTPQATAAGATSGTSPSVADGSPAPSGGKVDACRLLTSEDIQAVQGEGVKEARGGQQPDGPFIVGQCFYATPSFNKSVSLTLTQKNRALPGTGDPRNFWRERFGNERDRETRGKEKKTLPDRAEKRAERREGEKEEGERPPQPVKGVGDQAYWAGNEKVGVLYVLKGDRFLRISIGGPEGQQAKIEKMKELARRALKRL